MTPEPTLHLRFIERSVHEPHHSDPMIATVRTVRILQQFWKHPDGKDVCGDMFKMTAGQWRDVPVVKEGA